MREGTKILFCPRCKGNRLFEKVSPWTQKEYKRWKCLTCNGRKHESYRHWKFEPLYLKGDNKKE